MESTAIPDSPGLPWWHYPLYRLYASLTKSDSIKPVDLIFVLAGRMERKSYGLEFYRAGVAPRLLLSIGRFEVSKMHAVHSAISAELVAQRDRTAPIDRHFFAAIGIGGTRIDRAKLDRWNTYGELVGLRKFLGRDIPRRVMVVSTDVHLRRVAVTFDHVFRDAVVEVLYCPVPGPMSSVRKKEWWARSGDRRFVFKETAKLTAYRIIMSMPEWLIRHLMPGNQSLE